MWLCACVSSQLDAKCKKAEEMVMKAGTYQTVTSLSFSLFASFIDYSILLFIPAFLSPSNVRDFIVFPV